MQPAAAGLAPSSATPRTVADLRRDLTATFRDGGLATPELDARVLLEHALGFDHAALASNPTRVMSPMEEAAVAALAERRLAHEPVARILGVKEFWSFPLRIDHTTLVPR